MRTPGALQYCWRDIPLTGANVQIVINVLEFKSEHVEGTKEHWQQSFAALQTIDENAEMRSVHLWRAACARLCSHKPTNDSNTTTSTLSKQQTLTEYHIYTIEKKPTTRNQPTNSTFIMNIKLVSLVLYGISTVGKSNFGMKTVCDLFIKLV